MRKIPYESYALSSGKVSSGQNGALMAGALGATAGAAASHHHEKQQATNGIANGNSGVVSGNGVANGHNGVLNGGAANGHNHHGVADVAAGAAGGAALEHHHDRTAQNASVGVANHSAAGAGVNAPGYDTAARDSSVTGGHLA